MDILKMMPEFIFDTFEEAMDCHKQMFKLLREDGLVRYETLYIFYTKERLEDERLKEYGWGNLFTSKVEPYDDNGKWLLKLPEPQKIKDILKEKRKK